MFFELVISNFRNEFCSFVNTIVEHDILNLGGAFCWLSSKFVTKLPFGTRLGTNIETRR